MGNDVEIRPREKRLIIDFDPEHTGTLRISYKPDQVHLDKNGKTYFKVGNHVYDPVRLLKGLAAGIQGADETHLSEGEKE